MTLDEAIKQCYRIKQNKLVEAENLKDGYEVFANDCLESAEVHQQLADWLEELKERREQPEIIRCKNCEYWGGWHCHCEEVSISCPDAMVGDLQTDKDHYCAYAEKRVGEIDG